MKTIFCSSWTIWPESRHLVVVGSFGRRYTISFRSVCWVHQFSDRADVNMNNGKVFQLKIRR